MKPEVVRCEYNQSDPMIAKLGDLKIEYAMTQSLLIKNLLDEAEGLIVCRVGSIENLKEQMHSAQNLTVEEITFLEKLSCLIN